MWRQFHYYAFVTGMKLNKAVFAKVLIDSSLASNDSDVDDDIANSHECMRFIKSLLFQLIVT